METRFDMFANPVSGKFLKYMATASKAFYNSSLPSVTLKLVSLRMSQINGCGFCVDMHTKEATHAGEAPLRLHMVAAWREANVFTEAERAALEFAEQGTRIADSAGGVPDEVWANVVKHYDEEQVGALVSLVAFMNAVNRMNVITQQPAGDYQVGWVNQMG